MDKARSKKIYVAVGWAVSLVLIWWLLSQLDFGVLIPLLARTKWSFVAAAAVINIAVIALKAVRWQGLMRHEKPASFGRIFVATLIGMAGNNVLPARGGDWYKIYLLGKQEGVSKAALASITGLDKIFDGLAILILFGLLSLHSRFPVWVQRGTVVVSIVIPVSLAICVLLLLHHRRTPAGSEESLGAVRRLAKKLGSGMSALGSPRLIAFTFANSVLICFLQVVTIWCCQRAFGQHLDIWVPALVYVAINLAIMIPSAPSGIGPFEVAAVLAYRWLGLGAETAFNIALMYHAVQFFPVTISGFVLHIATLHGRRGAAGGGRFAAKGQQTAAEKETP